VFDFQNRWKISRQIGLVYHGIEAPPSRSQAIKPQRCMASSLGVYTYGRFHTPGPEIEDLIGAWPSWPPVTKH
jgi:hypothetical protein